jgi:hypothetical protein
MPDDVEMFGTGAMNYADRDLALKAFHDYAYQWY